MLIVLQGQNVFEEALGKCEEHFLNYHTILGEIHYHGRKMYIEKEKYSVQCNV